MDRDHLRQDPVHAHRDTAEGRRSIAHQEALIAHMERDRHNAGEARKILAALSDAQTLHEQEVERLLRVGVVRLGWYP
ncbi:hypothetical protein UP10_41630 [Bradyrhizobium sp. LTSPM299]|nr:hypothetical protein UP10_41630 [Bradyrhizobium sp. LTSPM299]